jgi:hypothetical protein
MVPCKAAAWSFKYWEGFLVSGAPGRTLIEQPIQQNII